MPVPYGSPARGGSARTGRVMRAHRRAMPPPPSPAGPPPRGASPDRATSRMSSWSDSISAEPPAGQPRHDVQAIALADDFRDVRPSERDAVEDVEPPLQRQLAVAAGRRAHAGRREPEDGDERLGIARPAWREAREIAMQRVVDVERRQCEIDVQHRARIPGRRVGREPGEAVHELAPAVRRELEAGRAGVAAVASEQVARTPRASRRGRASRRSGTTRGSRHPARPRRPPAGRGPPRGVRRRARRSRRTTDRGRAWPAHRGRPRAALAPRRRPSS